MSMWPGCVAETFVCVCVASEQLPIHRNTLPIAYDSKSFQINHIDSITLCQFYFPLSKVLLRGQELQDCQP